MIVVLIGCHVAGFISVVTSILLSIVIALLLAAILMLLYVYEAKRRCFPTRWTIIAGIGIISAFCGYGSFQSLMAVNLMLVYDARHNQIILRIDDYLLVCEKSDVSAANSLGNAYAGKDFWMSTRISHAFDWGSRGITIKSLAPGRIAINIGSDVFVYSKGGAMLHNGEKIALSSFKRNKILAISTQVLRFR